MLRFTLLLLLAALTLTAVLAQRRRLGRRQKAVSRNSRAQGLSSQTRGLSARSNQLSQRKLSSTRTRVRPGKLRQRGSRRGGRRRSGGRRRGRDGLGGGAASAPGSYGAPPVDDYSVLGRAADEASGDYGSPIGAGSDQAGFEGAASDTRATKSGFPNYADRCGEGCKSEQEAEVCGSDGKTYANSCELEFFSCRKYWDIQEVSQGPCESTCAGLELGMFSGFGAVRASNKGFCTHDFFRCCKGAKELGMDAAELKTCCNERYTQCSDFVASKPWKAGVEKFGR